MQPFKQQLKRGIQHVAARFGPHTRKSASPRLLILMYHRVLPGDDNRARHEEPGMYVTPETFNNHIKHISQYFDFIKLSEWVDRQAKQRPLPPNSCAITFDDGWSDNYEFAYPILQTHQVPATVFLVSDMIGTCQTFWPERLTRLVLALARTPDAVTNVENRWLKTILGNDGLPETPTPELMSGFIANAKSLPDSRLLELIGASESSMNIADTQTPALLDWEQTNEMLDSGLIEAGSHTRRHTRLDATTDTALLEDEIVTSKRVIEERIDRPVSTFCFPNGDYSPTALDIVRQHYTAAVTTQTGWNSADSQPHLLNRIGLHEDISGDRTAFLARISGWL